MPLSDNFSFKRNYLFFSRRIYYLFFSLVPSISVYNRARHKRINRIIRILKQCRCGWINIGRVLWPNWTITNRRPVSCKSSFAMETFPILWSTDHLVSVTSAKQGYPVRAGAIFEVTSSFGQERWGQRPQKPKKVSVTDRWMDGRTDRQSGV